MSTTESDAAAKPGAEGDGSADTSTPFSPRKDDKTPVGDTDQHSKAYESQNPSNDQPAKTGGSGS